VIHGIEENSDDGGTIDDESVEEIMKALHCPPRSVEEVIRIGRRVDGSKLWIRKCLYGRSMSC